VSCYTLIRQTIAALRKLQQR